MTTTVLLLGYVAVLAICAPAVLHKLTRAGLNPRLGVVAWLVTVAAALAAWSAAVAVLVISVGRHLTRGSALAFCVDFLDAGGRMGLPAPATSIIVDMLAVMVIALSAVASYRLLAAIRRIRQSTHEHAAAALMVGRPAERPDTVVVTARQATAYCVNGGRRRNTIVVTTAAIDRLDESTLAAVLAHETAHLRQRHHHILTVLKALAAAVPQLPLFAAAPRAVAPLLEMSADDAAARTHGRGPLVTGLISLTAPAGAPATALAAAGAHVLARVVRLNAVIAPRQRRHERLTLVAAMSVTAVMPALAALYCLS